MASEKSYVLTSRCKNWLRCQSRRSIRWPDYSTKNF